MLLSPDQASRDIDARSGYKLGLNIGQVQDLNVDAGTVQLWWYFSSCIAWTPKTIFVHWRNAKTHEPYMDWVDARALLQDSWGSLIKLELTKFSGREGFAKHVLTRKSLEVILEVIGADEDDDNDNDDDQDDDIGNPVRARRRRK